MISGLVCWTTHSAVLIDSLLLMAYTVDLINSIVDLFQAYCSHEFGSEIWSELMQIPNFGKMINHYQPIYGDAVFSVLADTVCEFQNLAIKNLLNDFSKFINMYY